MEFLNFKDVKRRYSHQQKICSSNGMSRLKISCTVKTSVIKCNVRLIRVGLFIIVTG